MNIKPKLVNGEYIIRLAEQSDVPSIINCVKEEYGDSYYRREFYDEDMLRNSLDSYNIFLVCHGDELCGMQSMIDRRPLDTNMEAASQIFRKKYRGKGLPKELIIYTCEKAKQEGASCVYTTTVTFHNVTQSMFEKIGMVPVAVNFGSYITAKMNNSYALGNSEKYAQAILVLPLKKKNAGKIYISEHEKDLVTYLYKKLNVDFEIDTTINEPTEVASEISVKVTEREQSLCIRVNKIGLDLKSVIEELQKKYAGELWTMQLILPTSDRESIWAQAKLKELGFYFTGLKPLCNEKEQIFMQYIGNVKFYPEEFVFTDDFRYLMDEILSLKGSI
ncbi:GNAT family N-acetyltransferase [Pseudobutyrivibrio sp. MD2005]|uniref:GNAT family N-acetyltransferase n=1 Tax=Pseudobutyrivibrio sp. MD2005 TaxID=1410616 RepID=UPI0012DCF6F2|nr:GNAT family N-acetyltransferase [Pseudobutyrivibrio sp. MD2005]